MKTLLLISIALLFSCKKKENTDTSPINTGGGSGSYEDSYLITMNSNYYRSFITFENISDMSVIKRYNTATDSTKNCPINYTFKGTVGKKHRVYTYSCKNGTDTTLYMTDSKLTYNYLQVKKNGTVIYEHTDSVGYGGISGSSRITANECKINY